MNLSDDKAKLAEIEKHKYMVLPHEADLLRIAKDGIKYREVVEELLRLRREAEFEDYLDGIENLLCGLDVREPERCSKCGEIMDGDPSQCPSCSFDGPIDRLKEITDEQ